MAKRSTPRYPIPTSNPTGTAAMMRGVCEVCGEPITHGKVHHRCKKLTGKVRSHISIHGQMDRVIIESRKALLKGVKHWSKAMGKTKRDKLFPDLKDKE